MSKLQRANFLTMINIPKKHPVFLGVDWGVRFGIKISDLPFQPLDSIPKELINTIQPLKEQINYDFTHVGQNYFVEKVYVGPKLSDFKFS